MRKLPVFASVGEVLSGVTRHYFQLLFAAWPAVLVLLAAAGLLVWVYDSIGYFAAFTANDGGPDLAAIAAAAELINAGGNVWKVYGAQLLMALASAVAAVRWHRLVLLGEGANGDGGVIGLRREDGTYLFALLKIVLLAACGLVLFIPATLLLAMTDSVAIKIAASFLFPFLYFMAIGMWLRLSLALPDASVGAGGRVFAVFRASSGNTWRMLGVSLLLALIAIIVIIAIFALVGAAGFASVSSSPAILAATVVIYLAVYLYFLMTQITMLSVAYREIVGLPGGQAAQEA